MSFAYSPGQVFESSKDGVMPLLGKVDNVVAGSNKSTITGVANKRIKVMSAVLLSVTAAGTMQFWSNAPAGGNILLNTSTPPNTGIPMILPWNPYGWFETLTGEDLYGSAITNQQIWNLTYIIYTP